MHAEEEQVPQCERSKQPTTFTGTMLVGKQWLHVEALGQIFTALSVHTCPKSTISWPGALMRGCTQASKNKMEAHPTSGTVYMLEKLLDDSLSDFGGRGD